MRTFSTATIYYHKFRLAHRDNEYQYQDAAAAALLAACKIEDTLKKSREILCAAYNLKMSPAEHLSSDDSVCLRRPHFCGDIEANIQWKTFEGPSKNVIGLERLMLEASGFDFRARYPQKHLIKLSREAGIDKETAKVAYRMMIDLYRTFAPLKQTSAAMSFACIELATFLLEENQEIMRGERAPKYQQWWTTRSEVIETILDLLDLYTHFQKSSTVGQSFNIDRFISVRIKLNQEMEEDTSYDRYTEQYEAPKTNGLKSNIKTPKTPITPASPSDARTNGKEGASPATLSPRSSSSGRRATGVRGQDGTIRFMLDAEQAKQEKDTVADYFKVEYEDYEVEVEEPVKPSHHNDRGHRDQRNGRDDRWHHHKRVRR